MIISEKIFELIKERGMSQKEFALATGISQSTISDWKTKKTNPAADKIMVICDVLNVKPYDLLVSGEQFKSYEPEADFRVALGPSQSALIEIVKNMDDNRAQRLLAYVKMMDKEME